MKKLPKITLWYWWLCFACKFFHRTFSFLQRPSQRHTIMGDISSRGHRVCMSRANVIKTVEIVMADRAPIKRGGKYCVAGSRDNVCCINTSYSPGISLHRFPSNEVLLFPHALWLSSFFYYYSFERETIDTKITFKPNDDLTQLNLLTWIIINGLSSHI